MCELDHAKDQMMTVLKLALTNLIMWARDHYFPGTYAQATWQRLAPFFRLPGQIVWGPDVVRVELHPFNDRHLTDDLAAVCVQVNTAQPHLPDGRAIQLRVSGTACGSAAGGARVQGVRS